MLISNALFSNALVTGGCSVYGCAQCGQEINNVWIVNGGQENEYEEGFCAPCGIRTRSTPKNQRKSEREQQFFRWRNQAPSWAELKNLRF